jgi:hypothetical protein
VELRRDITQDLAAYRIKLAVRIEEANNAFFLLKRLNDAIQQNAIEAFKKSIGASCLSEAPSAVRRRPDAMAAVAVNGGAEDKENCV